MKRNYFDSKASLDNALEDLLKYTNNWYDILLEAAKRYESTMKTLDEDKEDNLEGEKVYDDEEARDDAAFADFDRKHVSGYDDFQSDYEDEDDDEDPKYFGGHFGAGFEIDEPRPEDYTDKKKFEDDLAAYERFVEAGEDCVRRGLEKPEWIDFGEPMSDDPYDNEDIPYDEDIDVDKFLYNHSISKSKCDKLEKELNEKKNAFLDALKECKPDSYYVQQLRELAKANEKNEKLCKLINYYTR